MNAQPSWEILSIFMEKHSKPKINVPTLNYMGDVPNLNYKGDISTLRLMGD